MIGIVSLKTFIHWLDPLAASNNLINLRALDLGWARWLCINVSTLLAAVSSPSEPREPRLLELNCRDSKRH